MLTKPLFHKAIYVNRSPETLEPELERSSPSLPLTEYKRWVKGRRFLDEANDAGCELPIIFGYLAPLEYWAVVHDIKLSDDESERDYSKYTFRELQKLKGGYSRSDLVLLRTNEPLSDNFIRSYALVKTPRWLAAKANAAKV